MSKTVGAFELHTMPSGAVAYFRASDHSYYGAVKPNPKATGGFSGSGRLTGVSTVSKPLDFRPDNLMRWSARSNGEGIAILAAEGLSCEEAEEMRAALGWLSSGDAIWEALTEAELTWEHLRDKAAKRGTAIHEVILRALATGRKVPSLADLSPEERGYGKAVMRFWRDHDPEPLQVEQVVCSQTHGFAGRFDLRVTVMGEVWLIDAKTGTFTSIADHAQVQGYDLASIEAGFGPSDRQVILRLAADGSYELIDSQANHDDFLAALDTYRRSGRIGSAARKARKAAEKQAALA